MSDLTAEPSLQEHIGAVKQLEVDVVVNCIKIGKHLSLIHKQINYSEFKQTIEDNFKFSLTRAEQFMVAFRQLGSSDLTQLSRLGFDQLVVLLQKAPPVQKQLIKESQERPFTVREFKERAKEVEEQYSPLKGKIIEGEIVKEKEEPDELAINIVDMLNSLDSANTILSEVKYQATGTISMKMPLKEDHKIKLDQIIGAIIELKEKAEAIKQYYITNQI